MKVFRTQTEDNRDIVRLLAAITGFREQYGKWPSQVRLNMDHYRYLLNIVLTSEAMQSVTDKIELLPENDLSDVIAESGTESYSYGSAKRIADPDPASEWVWGVTFDQCE